MPQTPIPAAGSVQERLLRRRDVQALTGLSSATIYRRMNDNAFPRPRKIGAGPTGAVAWRLSDVLSWISDLPIAAPKSASAAERRKADEKMNATGEDSRADISAVRG